MLCAVGAKAQTFNCDGSIGRRSGPLSRRSPPPVRGATLAGVWRGRPCACGDAGRLSRRPAARVVPWGWAWAGARVSTCRAAPLPGPGAASRRGARASSGGVTLQGDLYGRTLYRGDLYGGRRAAEADWAETTISGT